MTKDFYYKCSNSVRCKGLTAINKCHAGEGQRKLVKKIRCATSYYLHLRDSIIIQ